MINALLLMRLATQPSFVDSKHTTFNGTTVIDPTRRHYYGNRWEEKGEVVVKVKARSLDNV